MALLVVRSTQMKLSYHHLIITGGVFCCLLSSIGTVTAFLLNSSFTRGRTIITRDSYHSSSLLFSTPTENNNNRRREFLASSIIAAPILIGRGAVSADEPNNIYYKSKADEEDPLAVFGRSLSSQNMSTVTDDIDEGSNNKGVDGSKKESSLSPPPPQADLTKALQEKSQQRRIDPRTHG